MNNSLTVKKYIDQPAVQSRIRELLNDRSEQFRISLLSLVNSDPKLQDCDPASILQSALTASAMNLPVNNNLGYVYLIPYNDKKEGKSYAQLQFGYKAFIQLAMRSGQFLTLNVTDVRKGELKGIDRLSGEMSFEWITEGRDEAPIEGYVAFFKLVNGFSKSLYMTSKEIHNHGTKFSSSYKRGYGIWKDEFDAMAKKTVLKLLLSRYAPLTVDMAKIQESDQAVIGEDGAIKYLDNKKSTPEDDAEIKEISRIREFIKNAKDSEELEQCREAVDDSGDENLMLLFVERARELEGKDELR